jgi:hypothetical protein
MDHVRGRDKKRGFSGTDVDSVPKRSKFGEVCVNRKPICDTTLARPHQTRDFISIVMLM